MQVKRDGYSIVIVGRWNPYILTPQWVAEYLFEGKRQIQIEFSLNLDLPNRYKIHNVLITPTPEKILLSSADNSDESLSEMSKAAVKLCNILQYTPLNAVGINFGYVETEEKETLLDMFRLEKIDDPFSDDGWQIKTREIKRLMIKDNIYVNLSVTLDEATNFNFDFNYHYNLVKNRQSITELLAEGKVISYKNNSLGILTNIYKLKLANND
jgi:hypothetical protein